jgi:hypothetical protein
LLHRSDSTDEGRDAVTANLEEAMRNVRLPGARPEPDHPEVTEPIE